MIGVLGGGRGIVRVAASVLFIDQGPQKKLSLDTFVRVGEIRAMNKLLLPLVLLFVSLTCFGQATHEEIKEWRQAAEQGYAEAQYNLGVMYANGEGVPEDDTEAVKWYRKAAEQGLAKAQYNLGGRYDFGNAPPLRMTQNPSSGFVKPLSRCQVDVQLVDRLFVLSASTVSAV
jgi:hypothetical protein